MPEGDAGTSARERLRRLAERPLLSCGAVFALALVLRSAFLIELYPTPYLTGAGPLNDSSYYHKRGEAISEGDLVGAAPDFLGPLYGYAVGATYFIAGPYPSAVRVLQALLGALSCALLVVIGRRFFSPGVGLVAGSILACYGLHVYYTALLLPTVVVTCLNLAVLLAFVPPDGQMRRARSLGAGVLIGLATLAKSNAALLLPLGLVSVWRGSRDAPRRRRALLASLLALGFALPITPIVARDRALSGAWVPLVTSGGLNLYKGNGPLADGTHVLVPARFARYEIGPYLNGTADPVEVTKGSTVFLDLTLAHVAESPGDAAALVLRKLALFFNAFEPVIRDQYYFAREESAVLQLPLASTGAILTVGLTGLVLSWRERRRLSWLYAMLAVQVASFVGVFVLARYRLVATSCLAIFAAAQLAAWAAALEHRAWRRLALSGLVLAGAGIVVHLPLQGLDERRGFDDQQRYLARAAAYRGDSREALARFDAISTDHWYTRSQAYRHQRLADTALDVAKRLSAAGERNAAIEVLERALTRIEALPEAERRRLWRTSGRIHERLEALRRPGQEPPRDDDD